MTALRQTKPPVLASIFRLSFSSRRVGTIRHLTRSSSSRDASHPAPPSTTRNTHASRAPAARSSTSSEDARARLARLQAQRLEELTRGRSGSGGVGTPNRPEQKWSNRTLIALATSVGACTYLMGTYHGYNAGKAHAEQGQLEASAAASLEGAEGVAEVLPKLNGTSRAGRGAPAQASSTLLSALPDALAQLLPTRGVSSSIQCEPRQGSASETNCRLAELTQYHCDLHTNRVVCQPIDRIFRVCKGRPAVEVSHIVEFDANGRPYLPSHLSEAMPPSSHWHELRSSDM